MLFDPQNYFLNRYALPNIAVSILILGLGLFLYLKNRKALPNLYFSFACYGATIWILSQALCTMSKSAHLANFWGGMVYLGVTFIPTSIYAFSVVYLNFRNQIKFVRLAYILSVVFAILGQLGLITHSVKQYYWGYYPLAGPLHTVFLGFFTVLMMAGLTNFYRGYKIETLLIEKERRRFLFIAFFIAYFGSVDYLPNYGVEFFPFGYLPVFLLFSIIAYIIIKYRLMDISTIVHKIIVYMLLSLMIVLAYGGIIMLIKLFFWQEELNLKSIIVSSVFITVFLFLFQPIKNKTQNFVDRLFYRDKYDYRKTLERFAKKLSLFLDSPDLLRTIISTIAEVIHIDKISLIVLNEKAGYYSIRESQGLEDTNITIDKNNSFMVFLQSDGNLVEREILMVDPKFKGVRVEGSSIMKSLGAEIIIPLIVQKGLIGLLSLGIKLSREVYKEEDISLLSTAGQEIAVAVNNYLLYEGLEKANRELKEAQAQLVQSAKMGAVGQLGAGVAHELNNPLGGILGYAQFMLDKISRPDFTPEDFKSCKGFIESIERESIRCKKIVSNLLKFSRKSIIDRPELIDIGQVVEETLAILEHQLKMHNVNVIINIQPDLVKVMGVSNLLQQVFTNLILNAQQAMATGGDLTINAVNVIDKAIQSVKSVKIEFADTGCGIPAEHLNLIFEPFFTTKTEKGTGLGLSISYQLIQDHKGEIDVKSQLGKGTVFTITLPIE